MKKSRGLVIGATGAVLLIIIVLIFANSQSIKNQLDSWKLLPQPEKLTELYFTNPNNLPTTYSPGQQQDVQFTIHNIEYKTEHYTYQIIENNQAGTDPVTLTNNGSFTLNQNQYGKISNPVTLANLGTRVKVEVKLLNVNESINYWESEGSSE
jgi:uncharacterized membrane protein